MWRILNPPRVPSGKPSTCTPWARSAARAVHGGHGRRVGIADGERRDLCRRRQILLEQRRRHAQHVRDVVEAVALVVGRQELGRVDLERQQIAHGVAVLGAVQAVDRRLAGLGRRQRALVQPPLEVGDEAVVRLGIGARPAQRRHLPAAQLAGDLLEELRVSRHVIEVDALERQAGLAARGVVALEAVGTDDALVTRRELLVGRLAAGHERGRDRAARTTGPRLFISNASTSKMTFNLGRGPLGTAPVAIFAKAEPPPFAWP